MKRDFTDNEKEKILGYIDKELEENDFWGGTVIDFFSDNFNNLINGHVTANNYLSNMDKYYKDVIDFENIAIADINNAFTAVETVDTEYGNKLTNINNLLENYISCVDKLKYCIYIERIQSPIKQPIFNSTTEYNKMLDDIPYTLIALVNYKFNDYVELDTDGNIVSYNWNAIAGLMMQDEKSLSESDYYTLLKIVDSFTMINDYGNPVINTDDFAKFISCSYIETKGSNSYTEIYEYEGLEKKIYTGTKKEVTLSPVFHKLALMLNKSKNEQINNYSYSLYDSTQNASLCYTLKNEISKSDIMNYVSNNMKTQSYTSKQCLTNSKFDISLSFDVDECGNYYRINSNIEDSGILQSADIYEYNTNLVNSSNKELINHISNMKISAASELPSDLFVEGFSAVTTAILPSAAATVFAASEIVTNETLTAIDISNLNNDYDQLIKATKDGYYTNALFIGGSTTFSGSSVTYNNLYIDRRSLEIAVDTYMDNRFSGQHVVDESTYPDITTDKLIEDFYTFSSTGFESKELVAYATWINTNVKIIEANTNFVTNSFTDSMYMHSIDEIKDILSNTNLNN